jgi:hypothetical protein
MNASKIVTTAALIALIGVGPGVALSQTVSVEPEAAIQAQGTPTLPDVRDKSAEVDRRIQEAKLASYSNALPQEDYIEAQREIARGDYREAMNHLNQAEQELQGGPNLAGR